MNRLYKNIFSQRYLMFGDIFILAMVTIAGFATHGELNEGMRMLTTFIPLFIAWFFVAPFFGLFLDEFTHRSSELWRVIWAMIAVVPLATWLRGFWLNTPILPIFVLVILGTSAPAMLLWRIIYVVLTKRNRLTYG